MRAGKTNASEPSMMRRKRRDVVETRLLLLAWDEARRMPVDCPSGDRREGGVRPVHGSCVERGNLRLDAKGDLQAAEPQGAEYRCEVQGRTGQYERGNLVMRVEQRDPTFQPTMPANQ